MAQIVLLHAADADVMSIYARYEDRRAGRGEIFTTDLDHILDLLRQFDPSDLPLAATPLRG